MEFRQAIVDVVPVPTLALDTYVLAQQVKTGVYRVCDELFPRLVGTKRVLARSFHRVGVQASVASAVDRRLGVESAVVAPEDEAQHADIFLSPFGVAPPEWLAANDVLQAHIVYDLIGIKHPEYFSHEAADEVRRIMDSLDEHTVVFAISDHTKKDLLAYRTDLSPRQVTVIPLAAGPAFRPCADLRQRAAVRAKYGIPAAPPYVLSVATLEIRKNLNQVVTAFVDHLEKHPDSALHLVLSGMSGWKLEKLDAALAAAARWRHRIIVTGFVEDGDLSALYSDALCFVYLSRYEGFGLPPLEAMACGTPVICADNSSLPEVVGSAGLLFNADDVHGVSQALHEILTTPTFREELSEAGLERARMFSWERCAEIVIETLTAAHERHARRPSNRRRRALFPGQQLASARRKDGIAEAGFSDYQNGSRGPHFATHRVRLSSTEWPQWTDRLPRSTHLAIEGGLRTRGHYKAGTDEHPLISYVTVVRNNTTTLARSIQSVQAQSYPNVEHIVLDGASTDGTLDLIRQHADRLDYFVSEPDSGLYDALNKAIQLARGQIICVLNSDDWLEPHAAETAAHRLGGVEGAAMLFTAANVQTSEELLEWYPALVHPGCYFMCANDCHNGIYATREAYEASGPYDTSYRIAADFKWIMASLEAGTTFIYTRETTVNYSLGGISGDGRQHGVECMRVVGENFPGLSPTDISGLFSVFFAFADAAGLPPPPPQPTEFLRDLFVRYASDHAFLQALAWASMQKMELPVHQAAMRADDPAPQAAGSSVKAFVRNALQSSPTAYRIARRLYVSVRRS